MVLDDNRNGKQTLSMIEPLEDCFNYVFLLEASVIILLDARDSEDNCLTPLNKLTNVNGMLTPWRGVSQNKIILPTFLAPKI